jgi:hypothetical protein
VNAPILDLPIDCLSAPNRLHLNTIESMMLWPDDPAMRASIAQTALVEMKRPFAAHLGKEDLVELVNLQHQAKPLRDLQEESKTRFIAGARSGMYLRETLGLISLGEVASYEACCWLCRSDSSRCRPRSIADAKTDAF